MRFSLRKKRPPENRDMAQYFAQAVDAMVLCTILAHEKMTASHGVSSRVNDIMVKWIEDYGGEYGNPYDDMGLFYKRCVIQTRDETEKLLGVSR